MPKAIQLVPKDPSESLKNPRHELFAQLFTTRGDEFGNGTEAYIEAFDIDDSIPGQRKVAGTMATNLLKNPSVLQRINFLIDSKLGFNDVYVDKQHAFLITQSADLRVKMAAIREYNAVKGRIKQKLEIDVVSKSNAELDAEYEKLQREIAEAEVLARALEEQGKYPDGLPLLTDDQKTAAASGEAAFLHNVQVVTTQQNL